MQVSLRFADYAVKQVENYLYFLRFRTVVIFFFFFLLSFDVFESIFWQRTVLQDIPLEAGNIGLSTTSPIFWLQLQYSLMCVCLLWEKLMFVLEDSSLLLFELEV